MALTTLATELTTVAGGKELADMRSVPAATDASRRPGRRRGWTSYIPPQHGAWAFLVVPLSSGFAVAGLTWTGALFALTWIIAYPVGYFAGRAVAVRLRRGSWTRLARREMSRAMPWAVGLVLLACPLLVARPWLVLVAPVVAGLWIVSLLITVRRSERDLGNDGVLVVLAGLAVPLVWAVTSDLHGLPTATSLWVVTAATDVFLFGSVLHVKSLLRKANDTGFRRLSVVYQLASLLVFAVISPWWLVAFVPAAMRAVLMKPGLRPAAIGAGETVVSVCFVAATILAT